MVKPRLQHIAGELRTVADLLDKLNEDKDHDCSFAGAVHVWWCDIEMGTIELDCEDDLKSWVYYPHPKSIEGA